MNIKFIQSYFKEYQKELQEYKTPLESVDEINKSINDMRLRIQEAKDNGIETSKIQGMEKGLSTLEMRKNNPKTAPLWQKILRILMLLLYCLMIL